MFWFINVLQDKIPLLKLPARGQSQKRSEPSELRSHSLHKALDKKNVRIRKLYRRIKNVSSYIHERYSNTDLQLEK